MESVESLVKQIGENVLAVQGAAVPELAHWGQAKLEECQGRWETLSKQVRKKRTVQTTLDSELQCHKIYINKQ